jgi:hypothetical protein
LQLHSPYFSTTLLLRQLHHTKCIVKHGFQNLFLFLALCLQIFDI